MYVLPINVDEKEFVLSDLWKFNTNSSKWFWIQGDHNYSKPGIYGTKDVTASTNHPGARRNGVAWYDSDKKLAFLFGGLGYDEERKYGAFITPLLISRETERFLETRFCWKLDLDWWFQENR